MILQGLFNYIGWLNAYVIMCNQQIPELRGIEVQEKLRGEKVKALLNEACPDRSFLWDYLVGFMEASDLCVRES